MFASVDLRWKHHAWGLICGNAHHSRWCGWRNNVRGVAEGRRHVGKIPELEGKASPSASGVLRCIQNQSSGQVMMRLIPRLQPFRPVIRMEKVHSASHLDSQASMLAKHDNACSVQQGCMYRGTSFEAFKHFRANLQPGGLAFTSHACCADRERSRATPEICKGDEPAIGNTSAV